jgi:hypothetical protein
MRKNPLGTRSALLAIAGAAVALVTLMEELRSQVSVSNPDLSTSNARRQRFSHNGTTKDEGAAAFFDKDVPIMQRRPARAKLPRDSTT